MSYNKYFIILLTVVAPLLFSTQASSRAYLDDQMTPREIQGYLQMRMSDRSPREIRSLARLLVRLCRTHHFSPETVLSLISTESGFDSDAVSERGAIGLMQLMPETALYVARRHGLYYKKSQDLFNPRINLVIGIHYLSHLRERFETSKAYLAAYNMGPTKLRRFQNEQSKDSAPMSVLKYVHKIQSGIFGVKRDARKVSTQIARNS